MTVTIRPAIPIVRSFDEEKAKAFYLGYLGFGLDWEHRFEDGAPLYCQISRSEIRLHLSEHHGDACPGSTAFVPMTGIDALHGELMGKDYPNLRPGLHDLPWGRQLEVIDPFGNRLRFCELKD
ncbi:MAG: VOC family protein [Alphaproteobacteria bacterium]|nr:VOC family protein [Alphaproteobacteria bacterium]